MPQRVTGRLVEVSRQWLRVDDGQRLWRLAVGCEVSQLAPADFVELVVAKTKDSPPSSVVVAATLLCRPLGTGQPFPSPGGDYFRLNRDRRRSLRTERGRALGSIRRYFAAHDFLEIEAPLMVPSPGLELHLQGFAGAGAGCPPRSLITSPE